MARSPTKSHLPLSLNGHPPLLSPLLNSLPTLQDSPLRSRLSKLLKTLDPFELAFKLLKTLDPFELAFVTNCSRVGPSCPNSELTAFASVNRFWIHIVPAPF